ncbi:patatin-like phospholipase family protein (plasmid) [Paracoccus liaowanqingii]|uniref:Patatin-like phospholipase family protein n=1 Tax=Paracoccus liaowanqingii TaxID=2560053 RepID=A0A4Y5SVM0_9RHOB|nr:patatin-like phospholipase family protein [Paracoccus liaowanqingii]QDA36918.1 patatin-like phospholipase family protein [Paracoccus liaowanqingii]
MSTSNESQARQVPVSLALAGSGATSRRYFSLVLGGGNALGAYHLGAYRALDAEGLMPDWIVGASIGAVTGAILLGNPPETRLEKLGQFWQQAAQPLPWSAPFALPDTIRADINNRAAAAALLFGRPGLFSLRLPGILSTLPMMPPDRAIASHDAMAATLSRLIDFERLNTAEQRFSFLALDVESGEEVWFDNRDDQIKPEHLLAATAILPMFSPIEISGRLLCDAGLANNLPVDRVFREPPQGEHLCIAVDLFALGKGRPQTLDESAARAQDLIFSTQSRRTIARIEQSSRAQEGQKDPASTLALLAYQAPEHQRTLKALDFSRSSLEERSAQGRADMEDLLERLAETPSRPGFSLR